MTDSVDLDDRNRLLPDLVNVVLGDITVEQVDVIVNAANSALSGGGGVDGAIHRAAGPELLAECRTRGRCPTGSAVLTKAYNLPAKYVVHAVGPVWDGGSRGELALLESCYEETLRLAASVSASSIAIPAIGCGAYRVPLGHAAGVAADSVIAFLRRCEHPPRVTFVCFDRTTKAAWELALQHAIHEVR